MASPEGNEGGIVMRAAGAGAGAASRTPPPAAGKRIEVPIKKAGGGVEESVEGLQQGISSRHGERTLVTPGLAVTPRDA